MTATKIEDLPTVYDPKETEEKIYKFWEDGEYFKADAKSQKPPYSIVIPPAKCYWCFAYGTRIG